LLTLARSQDGRRKHEQVELGDVIGTVAERMRPAFDDKKVALTVTGQSAPIDGDRTLVERLIENLLANALQYNQPHGFVTVTAERDAATVRLVVANSGRPVAPDVVAHLFEPFFRADDSRSRESGGAGLGLSIVAAVAAAHGGEATASARSDGGLVVTIAFPTGPAATGSVGAEAS
jgi:signal transduction histidine kinase